MFGTSEVPFRVYARRDNEIEANLVIRFEVNEGMGVLGMRIAGRSDPEPSPHYEERDIAPDTLRAGRFVHVKHTGQRQSYALSRIAVEVAARLPTDQWVELTPVTEYGFRYLVVPDEFLQEDNSVVQVAVATPPPQASRPTPVARVDQAAPSTPIPPAQPIETTALPRAPTPMEPALAESALAGLSRDKAIEHLRAQSRAVQSLHTAVADLQRRLGASERRERDLLDVLSRWQRLDG